MEQANEKSLRADNWRAFGSDLVSRLTVPLGHPTFVFYFLGVIIGMGGIGVWISLYQAGDLAFKDPKWLTVTQGVATYFMAISATALADVILEGEARSAIRTFTLALCIVTVFLGVIAFLNTSFWAAAVFALLGTALSLFLWWVANGLNTKLHEEKSESNAPLGGEVAVPLAGNFGGIAH